MKEYTDKYNEITRKIFLDLLENSEEQNVIMSPFSILILLGMVTESVSGNTKEELINFLKDSDDQNVVQIIKNIARNVDESESLTSANAIIVNETIRDMIDARYISDIKDEFDAEVLSSDNIVEDVNAWVREKTHGMIEEIADDSMQDMLLALINAISFMDDWDEFYEEDDIYPDEFTNMDDSVTEVEMMSSRESLYVENEFYTGFVKEYKSGEFSYMALLPRMEKSMALFKKAFASSNLTDLYRNAKAMKVQVEMPEFKAEFSGSLNALLERNGINQMFTDSADFSPVTKMVPLKTDSILHKAYIEVDRRGTKAVAVTIADVVLGCAPPRDIEYIRLDRPFVYAIMHKKTGLPVMVGNVKML